MIAYFKFLSFASIILFPVFCQAAFSSTSVKIDDLYYHLDEENLTAELCSPGSIKYSQEIVNIPEYIYYQPYKYTVTNIGYGAFDGATVRLIHIPSSVNIIGDLAFYNTINLEKCTLPSSITKYGSSMFSLSAIQTVVLNTSTTLSENMFSNCSKLRTIVCNSETPPLLSYLDNIYAFYKVPDDCTIYVPATAINTYKGIMGDSATNPQYKCWGNFTIQDIAVSNVQDNISDKNRNIYSSHGYVLAEGYESYTVYNISGIKITSFPLALGHYIVICDNGDTYKIIVD